MCFDWCSSKLHWSGTIVKKKELPEVHHLHHNNNHHPRLSDPAPFFEHIHIPIEVLPPPRPSPLIVFQEGAPMLLNPYVCRLLWLIKYIGLGTSKKVDFVQNNLENNYTYLNLWAISSRTLSNFWLDLAHKHWKRRVHKKYFIFYSHTIF